MRLTLPVLAWSQRNGLFFALAIMTVLFSLSSERFLTPQNISVILQQVAVVGIIAVPGAMLVLAGYVDLSVGSIAVFAATIFGKSMEAGLGLPLALLFGLCAGTAWGVLNGWLIARLGFSPIIVTLGGLAGARGLSELITLGFAVFGFGPEFAWLGNGAILSVPVPVWIFVLIFVIGAHVWYQTPWGRHMVAIGGAREAAKALGIKAQAIPFWLYVASGAAASLGGLIVTSQLDGSSVSIGTGMELDVLTAILLGGVAFTGGRGSLLGVLFGVLFIGALTNGLIQININPYFQKVAVGIALISAAGLDILYQRLDRVRVPEEPREAIPGSAALASGEAERTPS
jgi:ribose/xylose/arabinose/galactoside ABC-type transport system permease subunit